MQMQKRTDDVHGTSLYTSSGSSSGPSSGTRSRVNLESAPNSRKSASSPSHPASASRAYTYPNGYG